ncbi:MAG TPA: winged helix-turn-helix transcriptional regulator [Gaiellaceae bacterium]|nr:winged helix-turn-helix transcriptional regulator [Gaiellaceae bacterium]
MKRYGHYCPIAHALDLVGERWALLVVRELLDGPKRYTDLLDGMPGIGTNILASRLRDLEAGGVVRRTKLPPPAASAVYELTEYGRELDEALHALARWGARTLGPPVPETELRAGWLVHAAEATFDPAAAVGLTESYEIRSGDEVVSLRVADGRLDAAAGSRPGADAVVEASPETVFRLVDGELSADEALASGAVRLEGDRTALARFASLFSLDPRGHEAQDRGGTAAATGRAPATAGAAARTT